MGKSVLHSLAETEYWAKEFAQTLSGGDVVALSGELGSGKTTLVAMFARALGIQKPIKSPTFIVYAVYDIDPPIRGIVQMCHADLYRVEGQYTGIGLEEYIGDPHTVTFIEWPEYAGHALLAHAKKLHIAVAGEARVITESISKIGLR